MEQIACGPGEPEMLLSPLLIFYMDGFGGIYFSSCEHQGTYLNTHSLTFVVPLASDVYQNGHIGFHIIFQISGLSVWHLLPREIQKNSGTTISLLSSAANDLVFILPNQFRFKVIWI